MNGRRGRLHSAGHNGGESCNISEESRFILLFTFYFNLVHMKRNAGEELVGVEN